MSRTTSGDRRSWSIGVLTIAMTGLVLPSCRNTPPQAASSSNSVTASRPADVAGLGRIEPGDGVVHVAARAVNGPPIVGRLLVRRGEAVRVGQVLAELDNQNELLAVVQQAAGHTEVARRRLAQARAGAKASEVAGQQADVERLESELENARTEQKRYAALGKNVTAAELDRLKLRVDSTTRALAVARQRLESLRDVRQVDVDVAQAELDEAIRNEARAQADAKTSVIHSPVDGRVIDIHAWPGEQIGPEGLLELAPAGPMYAVAEIVESDIGRIRVGQRATITADALGKPVQGTVERISPKVLQNQIVPVNPANFSDARIVKVWIRVDDSRAVADFINLRVDVVVHS